MALEYLVMNIKFNIDRESFTIDGSIKETAYEDVLDTFLRMQMGAGKDTREPNEKSEYNIQIKWYPEDDHFITSSDTGNDGLRDGILIYVMGHLNEKK